MPSHAGCSASNCFVKRGLAGRLTALHHACSPALPFTMFIMPHRHALPAADPILVVARATAANTQLLCLDELFVTDVADAMLLSRLFGELLRCGVTVVFTSNRPPRDLYKGGLSRRYFEPFIHLIDEK